MNAPAKKVTKSAPATNAAPRDKSAAFVKVATKRTNKALNALASVASLANPRSYTYSDAQVERILSALKSATELCEKRFAASKTGGAPATGFEL